MTQRILLALAALFAIAGTAHASSDVLWGIVNEKCVPGQRDRGQPNPCVKVDLNKGYAIIKDVVGDAQYLLIPTAKNSGIDDPAVLARNTPNYFALAWQERHFMADIVKRDPPRDTISLAVNSVYGRTQTQLHIAIDCVAIGLREKVAAHIAAIGDQWARFPVRLNGQHYQAMRVSGETLDGVNPFLLVADGLPNARNSMDRRTIVVVGATLPNGAPGFVVLEAEANVASGYYGTGEELQDHSCAVATQ